MNDAVNGAFRLGDRTIRPDIDRIDGPDGSVDIEPKAMSVLVCLVERDGAVVSADELIERVWHGRPMGDNPVYKCITKLRKALGDSAQHPEFIATVPKKGYRILRSASPVGATPGGSGGTVDTANLPTATGDKDDTHPRSPSRYARIGWLVISALAAGLVTLIWIRTNSPTTALHVEPASIAVLVFESLEGDTAFPDLGDGISDEIRTQLAGVQGLQVASRTASEAIRDDKPSPQAIRERLRVAYAVEGTVRIIDDKIHYATILLDTSTGFEAWAASDTQNYDDLLNVQNFIARSIVDAIRAKISRQLPDPVGSTDSVAAFEAWLRGRSFLSRTLDTENLAEAEKNFIEALDHDSAYSRAHAGLCEVFRRRYRRDGNALHFERAESACQRALELDPRLSDVWIALGSLYRNGGRLDDALRSYERAMDSNATVLEAYNGLALVHEAANRHDDAKHWFELAIDKFPTNPAAYFRYAIYHYRHGRYRAALSLFLQARGLGANDAQIITSIASSYLMLEDFENAALYYEQSLAQEPTARAYTNLGTAYYFLGRFPDAVDNYRQAIRLAPADHDHWSNLALGLRRSPDNAAEVDSVCRQAIELARQELAINERDAYVLSRMASCLAVVGDKEQAREAVLRAITLSPTQTMVLFNATVALVDAGDLEEAGHMVEKTIASGYPIGLLEASPEVWPALDSAGLR